MKITMGAVVAAATLIGGVAIGVALTKRGPSPTDLANLARRSGDSAVTAYRSGPELKAFVGAALKDTVDHYQAEVKAAVKIVIQRVPVPIHDTAWIPRDSSVTPDSNVDVVFPIYVQDGVTVTETTTVRPRPSFVARRLLVSFNADTVIAALLQTPDGLGRFTAAATRKTGLQVSIGNAVQQAVGRRTAVDRAVDLAAYGSCILAGIGFGVSDPKLAVGAGVPCFGKLLWSAR